MPQSLAEQIKSIPMSPGLGESLERAHRCAREQSHRLVALEHLLLALGEDADAAAVLQVCSVDLDRLSTDVSGYLGGLQEDMRAEAGAEPRPDPELLRVLQAAAQAAQQSRRRQIDGAIVLAAIVGDAKSPAAGLLKAHGLTFEGAIRALQKATAQARTKHYAKRAPAAATSPPPPTPAAAHGQQPDPDAATDEAAPAPASPASEGESAGTALPQSAEDILAAARARIQQRSAATAGTTEASVPRAAQPQPAPAPATPKPMAAEAQAAPQRPPAAPPAPTPVRTEDRAKVLSAELAKIKAETSEPPAPPVAADLPPPAAPPSTRASWTPPPPSRPPQPPPNRAPPPPFANRPVHPSEGPPRPPLPPRAGQPQTGYPNRPPRAPWPEAGERGPVPRPGAANGSHPASPHPHASADPHPPAAAPPAQPQRQGGQAGSGPLVEHIPRRMRVGIPTAAQVRIGRDKIDGLILLLNGRGTPHRPDAFLSRALSVRLRAPDGGVWIEPTSPETVWVDTASGPPHDEQASWRWTVTPQRRGRCRLLLVVTARTVGRDGLATETAPPDRTVEVRVQGNHGRSVLRWAGLIAAMLIGAAFARFGQEFWHAGAALVKRIAGI